MYVIENSNKTVLETKWRQQKYPFQQMDIGDFFLVPKKDVPIENIRVSASWAGKKFNKRFITDSYGDFTKVTRVKKIKNV